MTQIGNQYTGEKQEYFFEQLKQCKIDRFKALSTERGRLTIYGAREAETMLQTVILLRQYFSKIFFLLLSYHRNIPAFLFIHFGPMIERIDFFEKDIDRI